MASILQNAFGNTAYVNQTNLNGKLKKDCGAKRWAKQQSGGGMAHPSPPLESRLPRRFWALVPSCTPPCGARIKQLLWQMRFPNKPLTATIMCLKCSSAPLILGAA